MSMNPNSQAHAPILTALLAVLLVPFASGPSAFAQNRESDLARENEQLRARLVDLEATLEAAMKRIQELESEVTTLTSGAGTTNGVSVPGTVPPPPAASPGGIIVDILANHAEASTSGAISPSPTDQDDAAVSRHQRSVRKWIATANRNFRGKVEWPVVMSDIQRLNQNSARMTVTIWDVATDQTVGSPFAITIPVRVLDRLQRLESRKTNGARTLELEGVFVPKIRFNAQRQEVGPFDNPRFIAPSIEMNWDFEFKRIGPLDPDARNG
jgi:hypothetical protein